MMAARMKLSPGVPALLVGRNGARCWVGRFALPIGFVVALFLVTFLADGAEGALLTNAWQVHHLSQSEAALAQRVRLRGVVTYYNSRIPELFIQDDSDGIYVEIENMRQEPGIRFEPGQLLEIEGSSAEGGFSPDILPDKVALVGRAALPCRRGVHPLPRAPRLSSLEAGARTARAAARP